MSAQSQFRVGEHFFRYELQCIKLCPLVAMAESRYKQQKQVDV